MAPPPQRKSTAPPLAAPAQPATPLSRRFPLSRYTGQRPDYAFPPREKRFTSSSCDGLQTPSTHLACPLATPNGRMQDDSSSIGTPDASFSSCDTGLSEQDGPRTPPTPPTSLRADMEAFFSASPSSGHRHKDHPGPSADRESIVKPTDQVLRDTTNLSFPSFGDFLASRQATEDEQAGVRVWVGGGEGGELIGELEDEVGRLDLRKCESEVPSPTTAFRPFSPVTHKRNDSFTFHPSPAFRIDSPAPNPPSSSLLLRSPEPKRYYHLPSPVLTRTPEVPHKGLESSLSHYHLPPFPGTPPFTPVDSTAPPHPPPKSSTARPCPQFLAAVPAQRAKTVTPPGAVSFFHPPPPPPASVVALTVSSGPSAAADAFSSEYPLSESDTAKIAALHSGRIPTLQQLAPPDHVFAAAGQQPIVDTGNVGPMVVQAGDWRCGVCSFVNWRRRKICLKCFPYANDIGHVLTIQSQRAAHLAVPTPTSHPGWTSSASPAASYRSPYVQSGGVSSKVPTADLAAIARTLNFAPPAFAPSTSYAPHSIPQQYPMSAPTPALDAYFAPPPPFVPIHRPPPPPASHFSSDLSCPMRASPHTQLDRSTKAEPAPLPPIIWSTSLSSHARPPSFSSSAASEQKSRTPSATSAGELAAQKKKREKENERVRAGKAVRHALQARVGASGVCFAVNGVAAGVGRRPWEPAEY